MWLQEHVQCASNRKKKTLLVLFSLYCETVGVKQLFQLDDSGYFQNMAFKIITHNIFGMYKHVFINKYIQVRHIGYMSLNYLINKASHFVCFLPHTPSQTLSLVCRAKDLSSFALPVVMTLIPSC